MRDFRRMYVLPRLQAYVRITKTSGVCTYYQDFRHMYVLPRLQAYVGILFICALSYK